MIFVVPLFLIQATHSLPLEGNKGNHPKFKIYSSIRVITYMKYYPLINLQDYWYAENTFQSLQALVCIQEIKS